MPGVHHKFMKKESRNVNEAQERPVEDPMDMVRELPYMQLIGYVEDRIDELDLDRALFAVKIAEKKALTPDERSRAYSDYAEILFQKCRAGEAETYLKSAREACNKTEENMARYFRTAVNETRYSRFVFFKGDAKLAVDFGKCSKGMADIVVAYSKDADVVNRMAEVYCEYARKCILLGKEGAGYKAVEKARKICAECENPNAKTKYFYAYTLYLEGIYHAMRKKCQKANDCYIQALDSMHDAGLSSPQAGLLQADILMDMLISAKDMGAKVSPDENIVEDIRNLLDALREAYGDLFDIRRKFERFFRVHYIMFKDEESRIECLKINEEMASAMPDFSDFFLSTCEAFRK